MGVCRRSLVRRLRPPLASGETRQAHASGTSSFGSVTPPKYPGTNKASTVHISSTQALRPDRKHSCRSLAARTLSSSLLLLLLLCLCRCGLLPAPADLFPRATHSRLQPWSSPLDDQLHPSCWQRSPLHGIFVALAWPGWTCVCLLFPLPCCSCATVLPLAWNECIYCLGRAIRRRCQPDQGG
jgi:hypothetical protein